MNNFNQSDFSKKRIYVIPLGLAIALGVFLYLYSAQSLTANQLRQQASNLTSQANYLTGQLTDAGNKIQDLLNSQTKTASDYQNLSQQYSSLQGQFSSLEHDYSQLNAKYSSLTPLHSDKITSGTPIYFDSNLIHVGASECSGSMQPAISCSDLILQYSPTQDDISVGDIITFYQGIPNNTQTQTGCTLNQNATTTHRVTQIVSSSQNGSQFILYITKGDANTYSDPCFIPFNWIVGKVYAVIKQSSP